MAKGKGKGGKKARRDPDTHVLFKTQPQERRASLYRTVEYLAQHGFHAQTIADVAGISKSQVYTATHHMQIKLRAYRDGHGAVAPNVIKGAPR